jgi:hypothetical protein
VSPRGAIVRARGGQITVRRRPGSKVRLAWSTSEPRPGPSRVRAHHHRHRADGDVHRSAHWCFHLVQIRGGDRGDDRRDGARSLELSRGGGLVGGRGFGRAGPPATSPAPPSPGLEDGRVRTDPRRSRVTAAAAPSGGAPPTTAAAADPVRATRLPRLSQLQAAGSDGLRPNALSLGELQTRRVPQGLLCDDVASLRSRQEKTRR